MSNYRTHVAFNLLLGLPISFLSLYYILEPTASLLIAFCSTFLYSTCFMNPDLDLVHQIKICSIRGVFSLPFRLYSKIFKHRGLSHSFLFGSLTRILWLSAFGLIIFFAIYKALPAQKSLMVYFTHYKLYIYYAFAGIVVADWSHLCLDYRNKKIWKKI